MKYYLRTQNNEVTQVWASQDEINCQKDIITARCEIFPIKLSANPIDDMINVSFSELQEIDRDDFNVLCNQKNLLAITNYMTLAGCHISA